MMLKDPAAGVPPALLPHMHLISKYRFPITSQPSLETVVGYLLEAPKIVRDIQPMQWQFLDTPNDGSLMLTWQPLEYLNTNFASDGFIWADVEVSFKSEVRGYTLEMFLQRSGYRAQGEAVACHCRKRYRLLPGNPNMGQPPPDPSLWLIHYSKANNRDHIPAASVPILPHTQAVLQQRRVIQSQGLLPRKEFMLHDRANWPIIQLPQGMARAPPGQGQAPAQGAGHRRGASMSQDTTLEEEEDVSRGDALDFITPRDIAVKRFEQHHNWLGEVIESPYPIGSIVPSDLGLGRKGPVEDLTQGFFDAPLSASHDPQEPMPAIGRISAGKFGDFTKRADEKLAQMQAELDKMKKIHERRLGKGQLYKALDTAEKKLRTAPNVTERRTSGNAMMIDDGKAEPKDAIDQIVAGVEATTSKKVVKMSNVTLVQRGGLQDRVASTPSAIGPTATLAISPEKIATPAALVPPAPSGEAGADKGLPTTDPTPVQTAEDTVQSETAEQKTGSNSESETPAVPEPEQSTDSNGPSRSDEGRQQDDLPQLDDIGMDVNMNDANDQSGDGSNTNADGNEWVMIDEDGGQNTEDLDLPDLPGEEQSQQAEASQHQAGEDNATQSTGISQSHQHPVNQDTPLDTPDFGMGGDFDNVDVDTAGDALASYGNDDDELNLDGMEDSAFGDAFHPQEDEEIS